MDREATIVFEITMRSLDVAKEADIAQGIKLTWDDSVAESSKIFIAIRKDVDVVEVSSSIPAVKIVIDKTTLVSLAAYAISAEVLSSSSKE